MEKRRSFGFRLCNKRKKVMIYFSLKKVFSRGQRILLKKDDILMQYTGVRDRRGSPIYEGDIILRPNSYGLGRRIDKVIFSEGRFEGEFIKYPNENYEFNRSGNEKPMILPKETNAMYYRPNLEVIGNIYENPELLKRGV